jgi:hypothetical protein
MSLLSSPEDVPCRKHLACDATTNLSCARPFAVSAFAWQPARGISSMTEMVVAVFDIA